MVVTKDVVVEKIQELFSRIVSARSDFARVFGNTELTRADAVWSNRDEWSYRKCKWSIYEFYIGFEDDAGPWFRETVTASDIAFDPEKAKAFFSSFDGYISFLADRALAEKKLDVIFEDAEKWLKNNPFPGPCECEGENRDEAREETVPLSSLKPGDLFDLAKDTLSRNLCEQRIYARKSTLAVSKTLSEGPLKGLVDCVDYYGKQGVFPPDTPVIQIG